jgi:hypothetical protein
MSNKIHAVVRISADCPLKHAFINRTKPVSTKQLGERFVLVYEDLELLEQLDLTESVAEFKALGHFIERTDYHA